MLYIVACSDMYGLCGQIYNGKILDTGRIRIQSTHTKYAYKVRTQSMHTYICWDIFSCRFKRGYRGYGLGSHGHETTNAKWHGSPCFGSVDSPQQNLANCPFVWENTFPTTVEVSVKL